MKRVAVTGRIEGSAEERMLAQFPKSPAPTTASRMLPICFLGWSWKAEMVAEEVALVVAEAAAVVGAEEEVMRVKVVRRERKGRFE